jgi:hypothetical protein
MKNLKKSFLAVATLILILGFCALEAVAKYDLPPSYELSDLVEEYNSNVDGIPKVFIKVFENERVNIYVDNEIFYGFKTENGKIVESYEDGISKPTLNVYVKEEGINKVATGEITPQEAFAKKYITYKGVGFFKKIKFGLVKTVSGLFF